MRTKPAPITVGQRYGQWTVHHLSNKPKHWSCTCQCSPTVTHDVRADNLHSGRSTSCGCTKVRHGHTAGGLRSPTYQSWADMHQRARDQRNPNYGAAGIEVCEQWKNFKAFLADMGERPAGKTLDRINPLGRYEPRNCRWADAGTQRDNQRRTEYLEYQNGIGGFYKRTHREWAAFFSGVTQTKWTTKFLRELLAHGFDLEKLFSTFSDFRRTPRELADEGIRRKVKDRDDYVLRQRIATFGYDKRPIGAMQMTSAEVDAFLDDFDNEPEVIPHEAKKPIFVAPVSRRRRPFVQ